MTTGGWIIPNPVERVSAIRNWDVLPDFASVNFDEDGALEVAAVLLARGVAIEAGLATDLGASRYIESPFVGRASAS